VPRGRKRSKRSYIGFADVPELGRFDDPLRRRQVRRMAENQVLGSWWRITFAVVSAPALATLLAGHFRRLPHWWPVVVILLVMSPSVYYWCRRRALRRVVRCELQRDGVPICIECGYDLRGLDTPRCPECGREFAHRLLGPSKPRRSVVRLVRPLPWVHRAFLAMHGWLAPEVRRQPDEALRFKATSNAYAHTPLSMVIGGVLLGVWIGLLIFSYVLMDKHLVAACLFALVGSAAIVALVPVIHRQRLREEIRKELRRQGIPTCPRCTYDLRGLTEPRCPECGASFPRELLEAPQSEPCQRRG